MEQAVKQQEELGAYANVLHMQTSLTWKKREVLQVIY